MSVELQNTASGTEQRSENSKEAVCSGAFQYRWNYADYEAAISGKPKRTARSAVELVAVVITAIFTLSFFSMVAILIFGYFSEGGPSDKAATLFGTPVLTDNSMKSTANRADDVVTIQLASTESAPVKSEGTDFGIFCENISDRTAAIYRLPKGVLIEYVNPDSIMYSAGLTASDIIIKIGGIPVNTVDELYEQLLMCPSGDIVTVEIYRNGEFFTIQFKF